MRSNSPHLQVHRQVGHRPTCCHTLALPRHDYSIIAFDILVDFRYYNHASRSRAWCTIWKLKNNLPELGWVQLENPAGWRFDCTGPPGLPPAPLVFIVQPLNIFNDGRFHLGIEHRCNIRRKLSLWSILYPFCGLFLPHPEIRWGQRHDICGPYIHLLEAYAFRNYSIIFHH